jgi:hypothetical protein
VESTICGGVGGSLVLAGDGRGLAVPGLLNGARTRPDRSAEILTLSCRMEGNVKLPGPLTL